MLAIPLLTAWWFCREAAGPIASALLFVASIFLLLNPAFTASVPFVIPYGLLAFAVGILIAEPDARRLLVPKRPGTTLAVLLAFLFLRPITGWTNVGAIITQTLLAGVLVGLLSQGASSVSRVLSTGPSQFLGRISYSLYLLNVPVLWIVISHLHPGVPSPHALQLGLLTFGLTMGITDPFAYLSARWIEAPSIVLGRRLSEWLRVMLQGGTSSRDGRARPAEV